jgi:hypothetical protein
MCKRVVSGSLSLTMLTRSCQRICLALPGLIFSERREDRSGVMLAYCGGYTLVKR